MTTPHPKAALREKLIDMIAEHLSGTYRCLRVWEAWNFGTMSQDDFDDVGESDTPAELRQRIDAAISTAAHPTAGIWVPTELAERVQETMGEFLMDHGWRQQDMDTSDEFGALLAVATKAEPLQQPERVPLTDLQIDECLPLGVAGYSALVGVDEIRAFARAVEAAHDIKPKEQPNA